MKHKLILSISSMAVVLFTGCAESTAPTASPSTDQTQANVEQIQENNESAVALSQTDSATITAAVDLNDTSYCEKVEDAKIKQLCLTTVKDSQLRLKAIQTKDTQACEELSTEDSVAACKIEVEVEQKLEADREAIQDSLYLSDEIGISGDLQRCTAEIKDPAVVAQCELNIIVNKAIEQQNPEFCKQASTEETRETCRQDYTTLTTPPPGGPGGPPPSEEGL